LIWKLLKKDFLRWARNPVGILILLILPFLFSVLIGLAFGPSRKPGAPFQVKLLVEDRDNSLASRMLVFAFSQGDLATLFALESVRNDTGRVLLDAGKASALLVIPAGFGDSLFHQRPAGLSLVKNPSESFGPKIAEETVRLFAEAGDRLVRIAAEPMKRIGKQADSEEVPSDAVVAAISVQINRMVNRISKYLIPPKIALDVQAVSNPKRDNASSNFYAANVCRMMVMCLLFILDVLLRDIYEEKEKHTLARLRVGPMGTGSFILSKMVAAVLAGLGAIAFVWTGISVCFGVRLDAVQWAQFLPFSGILVAALTGVVMLVHAFSRSYSQAQSLAPAVITVFGMLGGGMILVNALPPFMQKAAVASPVYWGIRGLERITLESADPLGLVPTALLLSSIACVFLAFSFFMIRRKIVQ
jgi:ABC-2 type transport system permease protein